MWRPVVNRMSKLSHIKHTAPKGSRRSVAWNYILERSRDSRGTSKIAIAELIRGLDCCLTIETWLRSSLGHYLHSLIARERRDQGCENLQVRRVERDDRPHASPVAATVELVGMFGSWSLHPEIMLAGKVIPVKSQPNNFEQGFGKGNPMAREGTIMCISYQRGIP